MFRGCMNDVWIFQCDKSNLIIKNIVGDDFNWEEIRIPNTHIGKGKIFIEKGASVEAAIINTSNGNVYIGKDAVVMEGCLIRGPFAMGEHAELKMGAKIYGATTLGPYSKIGGVHFFDYEDIQRILQENKEKGFRR